MKIWQNSWSGSGLEMAEVLGWSLITFHMDTGSIGLFGAKRYCVPDFLSQRSRGPQMRYGYWDKVEVLNFSKMLTKKMLLTFFNRKSSHVSIENRKCENHW